MKKHLKIALGILLFLIPIFLVACYKNSKVQYIMSRGNYFFEKTKESVLVEKIILDFGKDNVITLQLKDDFWHVKEADDYLASVTKVNSLINLLTTTTIYRTDLIKENSLVPSFENSLKIKTIDVKGNIIDSVEIAPKTDKNKYHFAQNTDKSLLHQITGDFRISPILTDWTYYPILVINPQDVRTISNGTFSLYRNSRMSELLTVPDEHFAPQIEVVLNYLFYLNVKDIKHAVHFNKKDYIKASSYKISLFNGLIYNLTLYKNDTEYWLSIKTEGSPVMSKSAQTKQDESALLYNGWFFKIDYDTGKTISEIII